MKEKFQKKKKTFPKYETYIYLPVSVQVIKFQTLKT